MKINLKYISVCIAIAIILSSCDKQLDIAPNNIMTNDQIFSNESALNAYIAHLYINLPRESFNFSTNGFNTWSSGATPSHVSGEALSFQILPSIGDGTLWNWWSAGYNAIRDVNQFIQNIGSSTVSPDEKQTLLGEAMFIRAYDYFGLVKRYGGVPIIKTVQVFTGNNLAELQMQRNKEEEVYEYIAQQLDSAILLLPTENERGRANKFVAYTLKSRAMLYAGSIAKYGSIQLQGLIGIPSGDANKYFQASFDAAKAVVDAGSYSLYNEKPDKVDNFASLFIEGSHSSEVIFAQDYHYPDNTHSYDMWYVPASLWGPSGYSGFMDPTLEIAEEYEYIDGTPGTLKVTDLSGTPIEYSDPTDLFKDKDPRCMATIIIPYGIFRGSLIDPQAGIIDDQTAETNYTTVYGRKMVRAGHAVTVLYDTITHTISPNGTLEIVGRDSKGGSACSVTGLYIRKYLDYNLPQSRTYQWESTQSWLDMRYGEVLLNYAEAAIELGDVANAKMAVNQIRDRAGIVLLNDADVTRDRIRHERTVELAFENQHYWDIRRWHIADQLILNNTFSSILPYYDLQSGKYVFTRENASQIVYTFWPKLYYEKIDPSEISRNPNLVQNPLY